jgi:hypothetical protein
MDVRYRVNYVLFNLLLFRFCHFLYLLERPLAAIARKIRAPTNLNRYRLMGRRGPLRVRALVRVR